MDEARFARAIAAIDAANAEDPQHARVAEAGRVTAWIRRLRPDASEELLLAARAHHIRRWTIPRSAYPDGRKGYLIWRRALHDFHAAEAGCIMAAENYDAKAIQRVQEIIHKQDLAHDGDVQALEDALCLVFLETEFHALAARLDSGKMIEVLRKTLRKMSPEGKALALGIETPAGDRALLEQALTEQETK